MQNFAYIMCFTVGLDLRQWTASDTQMARESILYFNVYLLLQTNTKVGSYDLVAFSSTN